MHIDSVFCFTDICYVCGDVILWLLILQGLDHSCGAAGLGLESQLITGLTVVALIM